MVCSDMSPWQESQLHLCQSGVWDLHGNALRTLFRTNRIHSMSWCAWRRLVRRKQTSFLDWVQHFSSSTDMTRLPLKHSPCESAWLVKTPRGKRQIKDERQYRFLPSSFSFQAVLMSLLQSTIWTRRERTFCREWNMASKRDSLNCFNCCLKLRAM